MKKLFGILAICISLAASTAFGAGVTDKSIGGLIDILEAGALTEMWIGGGAGNVPVLTTATGTGAPVRAGSPTFTTKITTPELENAAAITIDSTGAGVNVTTHTDAGDDFTVNTTALVVEGDTGNVGIGTAAPLSELSINGGLHVGGASDAGDNNLLVDGTITGDSFTWGDGNGPSQVNLLTNSGFGVWSNSQDLYNIGTQISVTDISSGVCTTAATQGLVVGKLVEFGAGGSTAATCYEVTALTADTSFTINDTSITDATNVTCYEVTPGIVSATYNGPDGWRKDTTLDVFREHSDGDTENTTKLGSFYSLKTVSGAVYDFIKWPKDSFNNKEWLAKFAGRTATFGCWAKTDTADHVRLRMYDDGSNYGDYHPGDDAWHWLEMTLTFSDTPSESSFYIQFDKDATTAYISQPMLVFGSSIGEGNYTAPVGEVMWLEAVPTLTDYSNDALADADINLESQSDGKIPKGAKAVYLNVTATGAGITDFADFYKSDSKVMSGVTVSLPVAANPAKATGWQSCDSAGDMYVDETGTITATTVKITGVQVN